MTDLEIFTTFIHWLGQAHIAHTVLPNGNSFYRFDDRGTEDPRLSSVFETDLWTGVEVDPKGNMVRGYFDCHTAFTSKNYKALNT